MGPSVIKATVATMDIPIHSSVGPVFILPQAFVQSITLSTPWLVDPIALSIQLVIHTIGLSIQSIGTAVLSHGRRKHYCHQQNTCNCNYFFHSDVLLINELDFSRDLLVKTMGVLFGLPRKEKSIF